MTGYKDKAIF